MLITEPIIVKIKDDIESLKLFKENTKSKKIKRLILNFPIVYLHVWKVRDGYEIYVGESKNLFRRTQEHYAEISRDTRWQNNLKRKDAKLYVIGHEHFNKSMTLAIENKLIKYFASLRSVKRVNNKRKNPQNDYYTADEFDVIFSKIWRKLRKENEELFLSETEIETSAIYKSSPLHTLTGKQEMAKEKIVDRIVKAIKNKEKNQLIFIEGDTGTGKTVLISSTIYEILSKHSKIFPKQKGIFKNLKFCLTVNNEEQCTVYEQIVKKFGFTEEYGKLVYNPTNFINTYTEGELVDVVFVDETHILWTQGKQAYTGKNQLEDIIKRARIVVMVFDGRQVLRAEQYWEDSQILKYRNKSIEEGNYIKLDEQLRIQSNENVINWIDAFTKYGNINNLPYDLGKYEIKFFNTPEELDKAIKKKAAKKETQLSRLIATYDWKYVEDKKSRKGICKYWEVNIGQWHKPWNREIQKYFNAEQNKSIKGLTWAEQPHTVEEVGSTFTIHGFDLSYAGVIIGPSVKYRDEHIVFDPNESWNIGAKRNRTVSDGTMKNFSATFIQNELRILMTRGVNGLYIYACDDELRKRLNECVEYKESEDEIDIELGMRSKIAEKNNEY